MQPSVDHSIFVALHRVFPGLATEPIHAAAPIAVNLSLLRSQSNGTTPRLLKSFHLPALVSIAHVHFR